MILLRPHSHRVTSQSVLVPRTFQEWQQKHKHQPGTSQLSDMTRPLSSSLPSATATITAATTSLNFKRAPHNHQKPWHPCSCRLQRTVRREPPLCAPAMLQLRDSTARAVREVRARGSLPPWRAMPMAKVHLLTQTYHPLLPHLFLPLWRVISRSQLRWESTRWWWWGMRGGK